MKRQKDIFDLIRNNQHKLDERPSSDAWDRLEQRLDQQQEPPKRTISRFYRQLAMAASILFLVGMVSFFSLYLRQDKPSFSEAKNINSSPVPQQFEELTDTDRRDGLYKMVAYQRKLNTSPRNVIQEGAPYKKLMAQREISNTNQIAKNKQIAQLDPSEQKTYSLPDAEAIANGEVIILHDKDKPTFTMTTKEQSADIVMEDNVVSSASSVTSEPMNSEDADMIVASTPAPPSNAASSTPAKAKHSKAAKKARSKEEASYGKRAYKESAKKMEVGETAGIITIEDSNLSQFNWMLGKWTGTTEHGLSIETWQQINPQTFQGIGSVVNNGKTTFTENMTIQTINNNLYYILTLDNQGGQIKYKFKSYQGSQAVFENMTVDFPKQVVLERQGNLNFKTILQNSAPTQINESQNNYFQNRNVIRQEQVERSLQKID